ncbi:MAG TPA: flagellin [Thermodesulfobacteriaceae bacterium]|nr:flagellin [Thermodesulfobacteriaceae bacterium]
MAIVVNTNIASLNAQRNLSGTNKLLNRSLQRLSSGLRINSAKDDAAGLAISDRMNAQVRGLNQAVRNANDGISLAQTAEGALQESTNILQRIRELSVQSANDTNTASDRASLQKEVAQLQAELNRIANTTSFNGKVLLDGTFGNAKFHVGSEANQVINVTMGDARGTSIGTNRLTNEYNAGGIVAASGSVSNGIASGTLSISGSLGSSSVSYDANASARDIAAAINNAADSTGVEAAATTYAKIDNVSGLATSGSISLEIFGQNETSGITVSANLTDASDLTNLAKAINDVSGKTGITATLSDEKDAILLENSEGYDISMTSGAGSATFELTGIKESGSHATGANFFSSSSEVGNAVSVTGGNSATVAGSIVFDSAKSYTVTATAGTDLFDDTNSHAASLSDVGSVDIGSQTGANNAINVIDSALAFIDDLRADLGAVQNRFESTIANLMNVSENISAAKSRIVDADFAVETANLTKAQILQQAGLAMLAQANTVPQAALSLLQ